MSFFQGPPPNIFDDLEDMDKEEIDEAIPIGDLDFTIPKWSGIGGRPYKDTYLLARHKDRILTPTGWHDMDEFFEEDDTPTFFG